MPRCAPLAPPQASPPPPPTRPRTPSALQLHTRASLRPLCLSALVRRCNAANHCAACKRALLGSHDVPSKLTQQVVPLRRHSLPPRFVPGRRARRVRLGWLLAELFGTVFSYVSPPAEAAAGMDPQQRLLPDALHAASLEGGHRHSRLGAPSVSLCAADTLERKVPRRRRRPLEGCAAVSCRLHETRLWSRRRRGRRRSSWPPRSGRRQHCPIGLPAACLTARAARRRGHVRRSLRVGVPRRAGMALAGRGRGARSEGEGEERGRG